MRIAGNVIAGATVKGSIEYAIPELNVPLIARPGIGTADNDGAGILTFREGAEILGAASRTCGLALDETGVALEKIAQRFIGTKGRRCFVGGCFLLRCFLV